MDKEQIIALAKELKSGSNWLSGKHDVYSYNRAPKVAALVLEAIAEYNIQHLVTVLRDANKWKLEGFGHFKDVTMSENDAPFRAADVIEATINAAIESYKSDLLKGVGKPVLYAEFAEDGGWLGDASECADHLEEPHALFTSYQVAAAILKATKPLEDQLTKGNKPCAFLHEWIEHHAFGDIFAGVRCAAITSDEKPFDSSDTVSPLFTIPPTAEQIANENAWRPIETAPKDGRELILLLTPSNWPQVAYSNTWWQGGFSVENKPTHWMPLPTPPKRSMEGV